MLRNERDTFTEGKYIDQYLFGSQKGHRAITTTQVSRILHDASDFLGRDDIGTHTMQKTFGYHHYEQLKGVAITRNF